MPGLEDHAGDRRLALAGGACSGRRRRGRSRRRRSALTPRCLIPAAPARGCLGFGFGGGLRLGVQELVALGNDVRDQVRSGDLRLLARRELDLLVVLVGLRGGRLRGGRRLGGGGADAGSGRRRLCASRRQEPARARLRGLRLDGLGSAGSGSAGSGWRARPRSAAASGSAAASVSARGGLGLRGALGLGRSVSSSSLRGSSCGFSVTSRSPSLAAAVRRADAPGPAYTFSFVSCLRARRLRGIMPLTASRMTSSGRRSSISLRVRDRRPPGYPEWR